MKIIVGANIDKCIVASLEKLGFEVYFTAENPRVLEGLRFHPDMQLAGVGGAFVCEAELYGYYRKIFDLSDSKLLCGATALSSNYPGDIAYNVKVVGKKVFHKSDYTDCVLKNLLGDHEFVNVSQGYSGCSICKVSQNAIITADVGIHKKAIQNSVRSLLISSGHIELAGFDYGFVGGASFFCNNTVFFFGDVSAHPDFHEMADFIKAEGTDMVCLGKGALTDYGGAITF